MKVPFQNNQNKAEIFEQLFVRSKQLINWMRKKVEIIEAYVIKGAENQSMPYVTAGEIYYAQLGENIGSEIDKNRPVLIFQTDDRYIRMSNMATIIPLTSNINPKPYRVIIHSSEIIDNHGIEDSAVLVQQIRSISKARLATLWGKLLESKLREVEGEVGRLLYKSMPLQQVKGNAQTVKTDAAKN